jgi:putative hemolysin
MDHLLPRLVAIGLLIFGAAFFAGAESALFSLSKVSREALASRGDLASKRVLALLSKPRRLIVTLIVCNELINMGSSSIAATVTSRLLPDLREWGQVAVTTAVMLPLILLIGEMTPKSLALRIGEPWAKAIARPLLALEWVVAPIRVVLEAISFGVVGLVGGQPVKTQSGLREEEFRALIDVGSEQGELKIAERRLIHKVFEFGDTTVGKVMTPAEQVFALPYEMPLGRMVKAVAAHHFSRVPIFRSPRGSRRGGPMEVVGIILAKDLVGYTRSRLEGHTIQDLLHPALFVPRTTTCDRLFREFQRKKTHLALVVDEYGRMAGLVTMEDLLEELFGEISDEKEGR